MFIVGYYITCGTPEKDTAFGIQKVMYTDKNVFTSNNEHLNQTCVYPHHQNTPQRNFVALLLFSPPILLSALAAYVQRVVFPLSTWKVTFDHKLFFSEEL